MSHSHSLQTNFIRYYCCLQRFSQPPTRIAHCEAISIGDFCTAVMPQASRQFHPFWKSQIAVIKEQGLSPCSFHDWPGISRKIPSGLHFVPIRRAYCAGRCFTEGIPGEPRATYPNGILYRHAAPRYTINPRSASSLRKFPHRCQAPQVPPASPYMHGMRIP